MPTPPTSSTAGDHPADAVPARTHALFLAQVCVGRAGRRAALFCAERPDTEVALRRSGVVRGERDHMLEQTKRLGAVVALVFSSSALLVFIFRLLGYPQVGNWIGYGELLVAIPL